MASGAHTFMTMVVFTPSRFFGQRMTILTPRGPPDTPPLMAGRKGRIAYEFNTTTVFLYDAPGLGKPRQLECYARTGERMWGDVGADVGGIVSAAHYIFTYIDRIPPHLQPSERDQQRQTTQFYVPKMGGNVAVHYNPYRQVAAVSLPNVGEMMKLADNRVKMVDVMKGQPQLKIVPGIEKIDNEKVECLVMDFVGDRRYILVDLTDVPEALQALEVTRLVPELDGGKEAPVSMVWYVQEDDNRRDSEPSIGNVHCRVFGHGWEEEGSGNAACAVAASITLQKHESIVKSVEQLSVEAKEGKDKLERKVFGVQQGELAGRPSTTAVEVDVKVEEDGTRRLSSIIVSGRCNFHSKGELLGA